MNFEIYCDESGLEALSRHEAKLEKIKTINLEKMNADLMGSADETFVDSRPKLRSKVKLNNLSMKWQIF
jgi:hypothetical protein